MEAGNWILAERGREASLGNGQRMCCFILSSAAMSATLLRDQVGILAKTDFNRAHVKALSISDPWFASQALADVLRYCPPSSVAMVNTQFSKRADWCSDDYQRAAVRAWQVRALAERDLAALSKAALHRALEYARRAEPPASRSEALFLLFQAACPLGVDSAAPLVTMLAEIWRSQPEQWRCARALVSALAILSTLAPEETDRILCKVGDERIRGKVARAGKPTPRPFFW